MSGHLSQPCYCSNTRRAERTQCDPAQCMREMEEQVNCLSLALEEAAAKAKAEEAARARVNTTVQDLRAALKATCGRVPSRIERDLLLTAVADLSGAVRMTREDLIQALWTMPSWSLDAEYSHS